MPNQTHKLSSGPSLSGQAYTVIRQMITEGQLHSGARITERGLASDLGVSPTPVREAIRKLEHERLLERPDGRSLVVANPSARRLGELNEIEAALTGVSARLATKSATDHELMKIRHAHEETVAATEHQNRGTAADALLHSRVFHQLISEASHNEVLMDMIRTASAFEWSVRLKAIRSVGRPYPADLVLAEHAGILDALEQRDGHLADERARAHVLNSGRRYLAILGAEPLGADVSSDSTVDADGPV